MGLIMLRAEVTVSSSEENQTIFYHHLFTVLTMTFTWAAFTPTSCPLMVVALSLFFFGGGDEGGDWVSFCIMSLSHGFVFNDVLKWAHQSHSVKSLRTLTLPGSALSISAGVTLKCESWSLHSCQL